MTGDIAIAPSIRNRMLRANVPRDITKRMAVVFIWVISLRATSARKRVGIGILRPTLVRKVHHNRRAGLEIAPASLDWSLKPATLNRYAAPVLIIVTTPPRAARLINTIGKTSAAAINLIRR